MHFLLRFAHLLHQTEYQVPVEHKHARTSSLNRSVVVLIVLQVANVPRHVLPLSVLQRSHASNPACDGLFHWSGVTLVSLDTSITFFGDEASTIEVVAHCYSLLDLCPRHRQLPPQQLLLRWPFDALGEKIFGLIKGDNRLRLLVELLFLSHSSKLVSESEIDTSSHRVRCCSVTED